MNANVLYRMFLASLLALPRIGVQPELIMLQALQARRVFLDAVIPDLEGDLGQQTADELARFTAENVFQVRDAAMALNTSVGMHLTGSARLLAARKANLAFPEQFIITDSRGAKRVAVDAVQIALDYYANQRLIDELLAQAKGNSAARFDITNPAPDHAYDGLRLTAAELQDQRYKIFHHGSKSQVRLDG